MPHLLCLQGMVVIVVIVVIMVIVQFFFNWGPKIWYIELLGVSEPWGYRVMLSIVVIAVIMLIMVIWPKKSTLGQSIVI